MNIEPTANYEITGLELYFKSDSVDKLKNTALLLADGWTYDPINYALIYIPDGIVIGTGVDIKSSLYELHYISKMIAIFEDLEYIGNSVRVVPATGLI